MDKELGKTNVTGSHDSEVEEIDLTASQAAAADPLIISDSESVSSQTKRQAGVYLKVRETAKNVFSFGGPATKRGLGGKGKATKKVFF